jgi:hypothetical protein
MYSRQMSIRIGRESKSDNLMVYGIPRCGVIVTDIEGTNRCLGMSNWSFWYEETIYGLFILGKVLAIPQITV